MTDAINLSYLIVDLSFLLVGVMRMHYVLADGSLAVSGSHYCSLVIC